MNTTTTEFGGIKLALITNWLSGSLEFICNTLKTAWRRVALVALWEAVAEKVTTVLSGMLNRTTSSVLPFVADNAIRLGLSCPLDAEETRVGAAGRPSATTKDDKAPVNPYVYCMVKAVKLYTMLSIVVKFWPSLVVLLRPPETTYWSTLKAAMAVGSTSSNEPLGVLQVYPPIGQVPFTQRTWHLLVFVLQASILVGTERL